MNSAAVINVLQTVIRSTQMNPPCLISPFQYNVSWETIKKKKKDT